MKCEFTLKELHYLVELVMHVRYDADLNNEEMEAKLAELIKREEQA